MKLFYSSKSLYSGLISLEKFRASLHAVDQLGLEWQKNPYTWNELLLEDPGNVIDHRSKRGNGTIGDKGGMLSKLIPNKRVILQELNQNNYLKIKPIWISSITDDQPSDLLEEVNSVTTVVIGNITYALATSAEDMGLQIIDISNPSIPATVAAISDGQNDSNGTTFGELSGAADVETIVVNNKTYALIAAYKDDALTILDISNPKYPL